MKKREQINNIKKVFDQYQINRENFKDEFFIDIIGAIKEEKKK